MRVRLQSVVAAVALFLAASFATIPQANADGQAIPNGGQFIAGANSVVWQEASGITSPSGSVATSIDRAAPGLDVAAIWVLRSSGWAYYLPRFPSLGSLREVGPLASMIVIMESPTNVASTSSAPSGDGSGLAGAVSQRINAVRANNGLAAVNSVSPLVSAASKYASFLASYGYPYRGSGSAHSLDGEPWDRVVREGYAYSTAGEVVMWHQARGVPDPRTEAEFVVNSWLNSPSHRNIILGSGFRDIGVGCSQTPDTGSGGLGAAYTLVICVGNLASPR